MALDILYINDNKTRITAFGCETGDVRVSIVTGGDADVNSWDDKFDGPITSVKLFTNSNHAEIPDFLQHQIQEARVKATHPQAVHLLVTNSLEESVVYTDIENAGLSLCKLLGDSDGYDTVICSCVADIDMDGENEIILGTYGQVR